MARAGESGMRASVDRRPQPMAGESQILLRIPDHGANLVVLMRWLVLWSKPSHLKTKES
jgi:hypothetical protein